jgi:hypothetical protein
MKSQDAPAPKEQSNQPPRRKEYRKPQLLVYGDLAEITKTVTGSKTNDGSAHINKHFTS